MAIKPATKPLIIWPIWVVFGIISILIFFTNGTPNQVGNWFLLALVITLIVYSFNVKKFGKKYWKNKN
jgi:hypothetical protein